jgi:hypoxanthine phosphoribosyltransferase
MEKIYYKWDEMYTDTICICNAIKESNFIPNGIIGLARGGVIPATIASHYFDVPAHYINWSLRDGKKKDTFAVDKIAAQAASGKKYLLIDDIVDTGDTLHLLKERMFDIKDNLKYAALWYNPSQNKSTVDFYSRVIDRSIDNRWIQFPWEHE